MISINTIYVLLCFWVFALAGPAIISILDTDAKIVVTNLTENEHQDQQNEKEINNVIAYIDYNFYSSLFLIAKRNLSYILSSLLSNSQYFAKIILPPPEFIL